MALTDMEELIARVVRSDARDYMSEALKCYYAGAFRACVVLSYVAVFDDLRAKLAPLAKVNGAAKKIHLDIEKRAKNQEVYETPLADQLFAQGLIDAIHKAKLDTIIKLRNKAAHPSGSHASAEEARYVFFEVIDKFLGQPQLDTMFTADAIIDALPKGNFFPSTQINDIRSVVESEVALLHELAIPYLVNKLIDLRDLGGAPAKTAARLFMIGLAALHRNLIRVELQKKIVIGKGNDSSYASVIVPLLSLDPALAENLEDVEIKRVKALLKIQIESESKSRLAHPLGWLAAFLKAHGSEKVWADFQPIVEALIEKYQYDPELMLIVPGSGSIHDAYFAAFEANASSTEFAIANLAAPAIGTLDDSIGDKLSPERAFRIVAAVTRAAENNAIKATRLVDRNFGAAPQIRASAASYGAKYPNKSRKILEEFCVSAPLAKVLGTLT